jgi:hypothetical protein
MNDRSNLDVLPQLTFPTISSVILAYDHNVTSLCKLFKGKVSSGKLKPGKLPAKWSKHTNGLLSNHLSLQ